MATLVPNLGATVLQLGSIVEKSAPQLFGALAGQDTSAQERQQQLSMQQLKAQQALQSQQLAAQTALDREKITAQSQSDDEARQAALRRAVARQKAAFGSSGLGNQGGGSSEAVLLGLFDESEADLAKREQLDSLRNKALDLSLSDNNSLNVLQQSQLRERQNLSRQISNQESNSGLISYLF